MGLQLVCYSKLGLTKVCKTAPKVQTLLERFSWGIFGFLHLLPVGAKGPWVLRRPWDPETAK